jgi:two-component system LytT family sensor kinase
VNDHGNSVNDISPPENLQIFVPEMIEQRTLPGRWLSIVLQILFWLTAYLLMWQSGQGPFGGRNGDLLPIPFLAGQAIIVYANIYYFIPQLLIRRSIWIYLLAILASTAVFQFAIHFLLDAATNIVAVEVTELDRNGNLVRTSRDVGRVRIGMAFMTNFLFLFFSTIFGLAREFVRQERERNRLENARLASEMKFLRAQINPHFLFNVMNNLYATVKLQPAKAGELISRISDMLRYVIYDCNKPKVRIDKEVEYLRNYVYFQELKDPDRVRVKLDLQVNDGGFHLEPMLLLPFVENAFKHSYSDIAETIQVDIFLQADRDRMTFRCANSIPPERQTLTTDPSHSGIGIANVRSRLEFAHKDKYELEIRQDENHYQAHLILRQ